MLAAVFLHDRKNDRTILDSKSAGANLKIYQETYSNPTNKLIDCWKLEIALLIYFSLRSRCLILRHCHWKTTINKIIFLTGVQRNYELFSQKTSFMGWIFHYYYSRRNFARFWKWAQFSEICTKERNLTLSKPYSHTIEATKLNNEKLD